MRRNERHSVSVADAELLIAHIDFLHALDEGRRPPSTVAQEHFVAVCRGKAHPETEYEKAYIKWRFLKPNLRNIVIKADNAKKYLNILEAKAQNLSDETLKLLGKKKAQEGLAPVFSQDELVRAEKERQKRAEEKRVSEPQRAKFKKRKIVETWGDRDAWKKDAARNKFNGR